MPTNQFHINDRVHHQKFGLGTIVRFGKMKNGEDTADVVFDDAGKKKMALNYANLIAVNPEQEAAIVARKRNERAMIQVEDRVRHSQFGMGTAVAFGKLTNGEDTVEVVFDTLGKKTLAWNYADLTKMDLDQEAKLAAECQRSRMNTFAEPDQEDAHGHGSHLRIIFDDVTAFFKDTLPLAISRGITVPCWADSHGATYNLPTDEPMAVLLAWPIPRYGMIFVIKLDKDKGRNEVVSGYPWTSEGSQVEVILHKVTSWHNRLEAQIECTIGDLTLTFFDTLYASHRAFYRAGDLFNFILAGLAYSCQVIDAEDIVLSDPATIHKWQDMGMREESDDSPIRIKTKGMVSLLPAADGDLDDYQFRGPVKSVTEIELLGKRTWIIRGPFLRSLTPYRETDLNIFVTEKSLEGSKIPSPGDDIMGVMWLQGYLWYPNRL